MPKESSPGFVRGGFPILGTDPAQFTGTGALILATITPGFRCYLERLSFVTQTISATAGTQTYRLRKGSSTGVIIATLVLALSNTDQAGEHAYSTGVQNVDAAYLNDTDTFTVTRDAAGTAFGTAPTGIWYAIVLQRPQARR